MAGTVAAAGMPGTADYLSALRSCNYPMAEAILNANEGWSEAA